jgi:hypothetical protein
VVLAEGVADLVVGVAPPHVADDLLTRRLPDAGAVVGAVDVGERTDAGVVRGELVLVVLGQTHGHGSHLVLGQYVLIGEDAIHAGELRVPRAHRLRCEEVRHGDLLLNRAGEPRAVGVRTELRSEGVRPLAVRRRGRRCLPVDVHVRHDHVLHALPVGAAPVGA